MAVYRLGRREFLKAFGVGLAAAALPSCRSTAQAQAGGSRPARKPNFIIIFADDQGYQDVGCFGSPDIDTPNLDRMATEGVRFTDFYAAAASCTPSRAALMTGCYPQRVSLPNVLGPHSAIGISDSEMTIADMLKPLGYATACYGKWHLGDDPKFLPTRHGFDSYFGLPYSNDMWPKHPTSKKYPDLPLIDGEEVIELNPDQTQLTTWYTERAVKFIEDNREQPFFLYLPHSMPHVPLFVSDKFKGKSKRGLYGDVIMEIDWSVGEILSALKRLGLDEDTLVFFSSDNGPWLSYGDHAGCALPLREGKGTTWDGGQREPCLMRWPGRIPAGTESSEVCAMFDMLPTIAGLAGASLPEDRAIDGKDIWPVISGQPGARSPHDLFFFYQHNKLEAVRGGKWKLHLPHAYRSLKEKPGHGGQPGPYIQKEVGLSLYDLESDVGETTDVSAQHPDIVEKLKAAAESFDRELKANKREPGRVGNAG
jgi:arylsulfatase A